MKFFTICVAVFWLAALMLAAPSPAIETLKALNTSNHTVLTGNILALPPRNYLH